MSERYNKSTSPERIKEMVHRVESRWDQLNEMLVNIVNEGIKFLFYVNSGGAVAVVAFIGTSEDIRSLQWPWWVLSLFFLGLVFVGVLNFARYHVVDYLLKKWEVDVNKFYNDKIDYYALQNNDDIRVSKTWWVPIIAYLSFLCFIGGGVIGFLNYKQFIKQESIKMKVVNTSTSDKERKNHIPKRPPMPPPPKQNQ